MSKSDEKVYRIQGLTCTDCAAAFEANVKRIPSVKSAKVNFGAAKITVKGVVSIKSIEKAGAFDNLQIRHENEQKVKQVTFWRQRTNLKVYFAVLFLIGSFLLRLQLGEEHILPVIGYALTIIIGGYSLFVKGIKNLIRMNFDMSTLMTVAIIGAAAIGEWGEGAIVVILFAISEALERYSMDKARQSIESLMDLSPKEAIIRRHGEELVVRAEEIQIGDTMIIKPGQKVAMDGVVVKGRSYINQATITGESIPVDKKENDVVFAGTVNQEGLLEVNVTKRVEDSTLAKIIHLVEEAQAEKAPSQQFVDRFAKYYTPAIILFALFLVMFPPLAFNAEWSEWIYRGLTVLVVGCPCALVISTPIAIVTAIGNAARNGVLIKGGIYLEEAGLMKVVAFDKTGTLTKGTPVVTDLIPFHKYQKSHLTIAAAIEKHSQHPLATAVVKKAEQNNLDVDDYCVEDFQTYTGRGVSARVQDDMYFIGSLAFFEEKLKMKLPNDMRKEISNLQKQGKTVIIFGSEKQVIFILAIADEVRSSVANVVIRLYELGIEKIVMLTGDNEQTAKSLGRKIGMSHIQAELLPEEKLNVIKELKISHGKVAMVGDGVNDAPALAASSVGIAMGGAGTDTALETADIALMSDDLNQLTYTIELSRKALRIIKQNILLSLTIKVIALILVIPGWLTLWLAIFADMGATLIVTLNSLRLLKLKKK
ncbi:heavy metal translocating P-type ATPase [Bacillus sp. FJAT-45037]|uniref:heavy metal translocating P-type ATPase n=1 Tax=Bacillus sp. FJAT-45037 TaxID=2011007 RepID=UPI000C237D90|nr:heavy metal translocating P-type ATPase [Bacillus sp. FJAT-45037]